MMHRNSNIKLENILCVSLLVEMMFLWAKLNVEVCLVVFLLRLVALCSQIPCNCQFERMLFSCFVMKCAVSVGALCATVHDLLRRSLQHD